jgi:hypothetical protein
MSPNAGEGGSCGASANAYSCTQEPNKLWRSTYNPYLTYDYEPLLYLPGEDAVGRLFRNLYSEGEPVPDPHRLHLLRLAVQDADPESRLWLDRERQPWQPEKYRDYPRPPSL